MTVKIRFQFQIVLFGLISFSTCGVHAQDTPPMRVVRDIMTLKASIRSDSNNRMVDIITAIPGVSTDLRYATRHNFMNKRLYPAITTTYVRLPVAAALRNVQAVLVKQGMALKIFDAYRPYAVTVNMWELIKDERYVANPKNGSGHNRGIAVDLTIINLQTGKELNMGTGFDNFSDTAHHSFMALTKEVTYNRTLLKTIMEKHGFKSLETEWWHYSWPGATYFDVLDISFRKLKKMQAGNF